MPVIVKKLEGPPETEWHATPEFKKLHAENIANVAIARGRWEAMKDEFIERIITGREVHFPSLSAKYGMGYQVTRNRASKGGWYKEIEKRREEREELLDTKMTERTLLVLEKLNEDFATSEEAIRKRHALFARNLQTKALKGLNSMKLKDFSATELLRMLELGLREERFAFGLRETADLPPPPDANEQVQTQYRPIMEQLGGHAKVQQIGTLLLKHLQRQGGSVDDVEAHAPADEGDGTVAGAKKRAVQLAAKPKKVLAKFKVGPRAAP